MCVVSACRLLLHRVRAGATSVAVIAARLGKSVPTTYRYLTLEAAPSTIAARLMAIAEQLAGDSCLDSLLPIVSSVAIGESDLRAFQKQSVELPGQKVAMERDGCWPIFVPGNDLFEVFLSSDAPLSLMQPMALPDMTLCADGLASARKKAMDDHDGVAFDTQIDDCLDAIRAGGRRIVVVKRFPAQLSAIRSLFHHESAGTLLSLQNDPAITMVASNADGARREILDAVLALIDNGQSEADMVDALEAYRVAR